MRKINIIDKTLGFFSPKYALDAARFRAAASLFGGTNYDSTTQTPHYNVSLFDNTEDEDIDELQASRATSRTKYNNNGFYRGVVKCATDHVIGTGLKAKSTIKRSQVPNITEKRVKEIETILNDYFSSWADSTIVDVTGKDNFYTLQRLAYSGYKIDGDSFATLPLTTISKDNKVIQVNLLAAQYIESTKSDFIQGIKVSKNNLPLKYSIKQKDGTFKEVSTFSNRKRNVLHIFEREKQKQVRGLPFLNPIMRDIDAIDQYMKFELTAAKLAAIFFGSIESQTKEEIFGDEQDDLLSGNGVQKKTKKNTVKENSITQLQTGDKLNIHQQGRDNPNYDKFIMTSLQKLSTNTRIPLEIILAQFVSSYSASRAAMLQMLKFTDPERDIFVNSFCKPTRDQVITWGVLSGQLDIPEFFDNRTALLRATWLGSPMGSVDPMKDVKAKVAAVDAFLTTREKATIDLGNGDFETNVKILEDEKELIKKLIPEETINVN